MIIDQDIQSHKMRYLPNCVYWIYLSKSIKKYINKNMNEIDWINLHPIKILHRSNI
jgi:hypothetical protein